MLETAVLIILAFALPPVCVLATDGLGIPLAINIGLTLFGWVPGVIHALYCIVT